jgi:predicted ATPase
MRRFALTGGHGVGKSSIILWLERTGEAVSFEAASSVRALERARGVAFPEDNPRFESTALTLHLQRERALPRSEPRIFLDRGAPDHLAYSRVGRWPLSPAEINTCLAARYDAAFLIEPPPGGVPALDRVESRFCQRLVHAIEQIYREIGTPIIWVPYGPCTDRARFILDTVRRGWPEPDKHDNPGGLRRRRGQNL